MGRNAPAWDILEPQQEGVYKEDRKGGTWWVIDRWTEQGAADYLQETGGLGEVDLKTTRTLITAPQFAERIGANSKTVTSWLKDRYFQFVPQRCISYAFELDLRRDFRTIPKERQYPVINGQIPYLLIRALVENRIEGHTGIDPLIAKKDVHQKPDLNTERCWIYNRQDKLPPPKPPVMFWDDWHKKEVMERGKKVMRPKRMCLSARVGSRAIWGTKDKPYNTDAALINLRVGGPKDSESAERIYYGLVQESCDIRCVNPHHILLVKGASKMHRYKFKEEYNRSPVQVGHNAKLTYHQLEFIVDSIADGLSDRAIVEDLRQAFPGISTYTKQIYDIRRGRRYKIPVAEIRKDQDRWRKKKTMTIHEDD